MVYRTHNCGELTEKHSGKKVKLAGWINTIRGHGKIGFIDIRDRYALTQLIVDKKILESHLNDEDIIAIEGIVNKRPKGTINKNMPTGNIELKVSKLERVK